MLARLIAIGACASLALLPASVGAQSVRLDLVFEKPTVVPAEPVVAHVTITNTGTDGLSIPEALEPEYGRLRFFVTRPGSSAKAASGRGSPSRTWRLAPWHPAGTSRWRPKSSSARPAGLFRRLARPRQSRVRGRVIAFGAAARPAAGG